MTKKNGPTFSYWIHKGFVVRKSFGRPRLYVMGKYRDGSEDAVPYTLFCYPNTGETVYAGSLKRAKFLVGFHLRHDNHFWKKGATK